MQIRQIIFFSVFISNDINFKKIAEKIAWIILEYKCIRDIIRIIQIKMSDDKLFVVENGYNTCYIDSLLIAMFYKTSCLENMLRTDPKNSYFIYLQEIIKTKFVDQIRKKVSVTADIMNEIRNFANICGWKNGSYHQLLEQQDVSEFYIFLTSNMDTMPIEIQRQTITEALKNENDIGRIESLPYISLAVPVLDSDQEVSVKMLLNSWMNDNTADLKREIYEKGIKKTKVVKGFNIYKIVNIPPIVAISLNRFTGGERIETKIDIQKRIKLYHVCDEGNGLKWRIHAIICHRGLTPKSGHYYSILFDDDKWLVFDDLSIPCLKEVNIKDKIVMDTIKRECVFLIYTYDDSFV